MSGYKGVLFLEGVFKTDVIKLEDEFENRMFDDIEVVDTVVYDKQPREFSGIENWPTKTNLMCNFVIKPACALNDTVSLI